MILTEAEQAIYETMSSVDKAIINAYEEPTIDLSGPIKMKAKDGNIYDSDCDCEIGDLLAFKEGSPPTCGGCGGNFVVSS